MTRARSRLTCHAHYRLDVMSRGPRTYGPKDYQIKALARRGLVEPLPDQPNDAPRRWTITDAGRSALQAFAEAQA